MNFTSQVCTTKEQSERLLKLGLNTETADMGLIGDIPIVLSTTWANADPMFDTPAWSLHRLIEMLNYQVIYNHKKYEPVIVIDGMAYVDLCDDDPIVGWFRDLYTDAIDCIEWLISIEQFNKKYLEIK